VRLFDVVIQYDTQSHDFVVLGIFTLPQDADAFLGAFNVDSPNNKARVIRQQPMHWIRRVIVQERLGTLTNVLLRLEMMVGQP
jgi:hypothetical protein